MAGPPRVTPPPGAVPRQLYDEFGYPATPRLDSPAPPPAPAGMTEAHSVDDWNKYVRGANLTSVNASPSVGAEPTTAAAAGSGTASTFCHSVLPHTRRRPPFRSSTASRLWVCLGPLKSSSPLLTEYLEDALKLS
jgi:hypothetical protein